MTMPLLKVCFEIPAELEQWVSVFVAEAFPQGFLSEQLKGSKRWVLITAWLRNRRRLDQLQHRVEAWGGRRFCFEPDESAARVISAAVPAQHIACFHLVCEGQAGADDPDAIRLRQGQAFGTGLHESTRLILKELGVFPAAQIKNRTVMDIGAGTGVLGFAALRRGAKKVWAVEKDAPSREDLKYNRALNSLDARRMVVARAGFPSTQLKIKVDLVLANILTPVHIALMPALAEVTVPGGHLLLSGIHGKIEMGQVRKAARAAGLSPLQGKTLRKWELLILKKSVLRH